MEDYFAALEAAFDDYYTDLEKAAGKQKVTDGLFGFGRSLKDDACHDRFDGRVKEAVRGICAADPPPEEAERAVRLLLRPRDDRFTRTEARWMLRAAERHTLPLIPYLDEGAAADLAEDYARRYRPWDRLPAQKEVCRALKDRARGKK